MGFTKYGLQFAACVLGGIIVNRPNLRILGTDWSPSSFFILYFISYFMFDVSVQPCRLWQTSPSSLSYMKFREVRGLVSWYNFWRVFVEGMIDYFNTHSVGHQGGRYPAIIVSGREWDQVVERLCERGKLDRQWRIFRLK